VVTVALERFPLKLLRDLTSVAVEFGFDNFKHSCSHHACSCICDGKHSTRAIIDCPHIVTATVYTNSGEPEGARVSEFRF